MRTHPVLLWQGRHHRSREVLDEVAAEEPEVLKTPAGGRLLCLEHARLVLQADKGMSARAEDTTDLGVLRERASQGVTDGGGHEIRHKHVLCPLELNLAIFDIHHSLLVGFGG